MHLHFYAVDLGRLPDGGWTVLADRTEAPAGAGYALENRIIVSQMLPELFRDCRVERLATFFAGFRDKLFQLTGVARPHAVLLTPGPLNEAYFEHAYLARYLGFTLVEGEDLTVRDRHVYLKTLAGPRKVDLILRRQDSDYCDPLELRSESALGVPGICVSWLVTLRPSPESTRRRSAAPLRVVKRRLPRQAGMRVAS